MADCGNVSPGILPGAIVLQHFIVLCQCSHTGIDNFCRSRTEKLFRSVNSPTQTNNNETLA